MSRTVARSEPEAAGRRGGSRRLQIVPRRADFVIARRSHPDVIRSEYELGVVTAEEQPAAHVLRTCGLMSQIGLSCARRSLGRRSTPCRSISTRLPAGSRAYSCTTSPGSSTRWLPNAARSNASRRSVRPVRGLQIVDGDGEMLVARRLRIPLDQVELRARSERQPLGYAEVGLGTGSAVRYFPAEIVGRTESPAPAPKESSCLAAGSALKATLAGRLIVQCNLCWSRMLVSPPSCV